MKVDLSKEFAAKLAIMIDSSLINFKHYELWCEEYITNLEEPPFWIIELTSIKYYKEAVNCVNAFAYWEPFLDFSKFYLNDFYISCLYVRYMRRHISWATFLLLAGQYSDGNDCRRDCSYFYHFLNQFEDKDYSLEEELLQSSCIKSEFNKQIEEVSHLYDYFLNYKRLYHERQKNLLTEYYEEKK